MAAGLPILSSLRGELEVLLLRKKIGLQYLAGNVDSLIKQIRWFADHPAERHAMGQRAMKVFQEHFSVEIIYSRLVTHLEAIAEPHTYAKNAKECNTHEESQ
jgi:glycosyltransferase involved in cell wall biosynthesis